MEEPTTKEARNELNITIEALPAMRVACCRAVGLTPEEDSSARLAQWFEQAGLGSPARHFGFDVDVSAEQSAAGLRGYEVWGPLPEGAAPGGGLPIREFSGGLYAVMTLVNPFTDPFTHIPAGWKKLHDWVIRSDAYRGADHQWLEELITRPDGTADLKLYHPVAPVNGH